MMKGSYSTVWPVVLEIVENAEAGQGMCERARGLGRAREGSGVLGVVRGLYPDLKNSLLHREVDDRDEICLEFIAPF